MHRKKIRVSEKMIFILTGFSVVVAQKRHILSNTQGFT